MLVPRWHSEKGTVLQKPLYIRIKLANLTPNYLQKHRHPNFLLFLQWRVNVLKITDDVLKLDIINNGALSIKLKAYLLGQLNHVVNLTITCI